MGSFQKKRYVRIDYIIHKFEYNWKWRSMIFLLEFLSNFNWIHIELNQKKLSWQIIPSVTQLEYIMYDLIYNMWKSTKIIDIQ